jgi:chemotaxis protein MotB
MRLHKRLRSKPPGHTDDWLITYADMITLLFCIVVVFLAIPTGENEKPPAPQWQPPAAQPMPAPLAFADARPFHSLADADEPADDDTDEAQVTFNDRPATSPLQPLKTQGEFPPPAALPAATENAEFRAMSRTEQHGISVRVPATDFKPGGLADRIPPGDRITTLEISSATLFDRGSATLRESGKVFLQSATADLRSDSFKDYEITVGGHTDDAPINTVQFASNWEPSTARAAAVVDYLLDQGISARRLRAAGYADTFPIAPNCDAGGNPIPENQAKNRRVVIKLEKIERGPLVVSTASGSG